MKDFNLASSHRKVNLGSLVVIQRLLFCNHPSFTSKVQGRKGACREKFIRLIFGLKLISVV